MSGEMNSLMRVNAWFLLFAIPLFFVLYWCSNYFTSLATSKFDFMGNVGMAFPGGADTLQQAQIAVYDAWQIVFYLLVPAITITFIGMAGAFNCLKAFMWGEKVEKSRKPSSKASKILVEIPYRYACRFASRACARQRVRILPEIEGDGCAQRRTLGDDNRRVSC